ncbi:AraC family transcriptional regulator [uncultured Roseibium sp.]|uniref:helix-turn-helix domain-containing protein n=1 Tax=uncultured Roseibium sp. TaxID=1936171 RepID=UPI00260A3CA9|nr:AraC family transcriptional regulator [uncultured Roseibium sp.]
MLFVPLPFVNALLLALVFVFLKQSNGTTATRAFLTLIALCCLQSVILGLRWGYEIEALRFVLPVLAALLPPLAYESFRGLVDQSRPGMFRLAAAPLAALIILALVLFAPILVDGALIILFLAYALALAGIAWRGPDGLGLARLDSATSAHRALWLAAFCLSLSAGFDLVILFDFERSGGSHAALLVSNANIISLLLIGLAALTAGRAQTETNSEPEPAPQSATSEDAEILARIDALMTTQRLYRDDTLNLTRLARRAGLPARQVSQAINRVRGMNVSRYVNDFRIKDVCTLLRQNGVTVTEAMYRAGFSTKSNFNREFLRAIGMTPDQWRKAESRDLEQKDRKAR